MKKPLPIGVDNFEKIIKDGYCYIDKTMFIKELLDLKGEVNLFIRPRRFGKTLNLSMLRYFFEDTGDVKKNEENKSLFCGLNITEQGKEYTEYMGNYPVINLTLKSAKQPTFESAYGKMKRAIADEFQRHQCILSNGKINEEDKQHMMTYYGVESRFPTMREWYDGYLFGDTEVYNPWSVINFVYDLYADVSAFPHTYWINTSSNDIIKDLIARAGRETKGQIETLLSGGTLEIQVHEEVTHGDMYSNGENLWNFLYFTGYLTKESELF